MKYMGSKNRYAKYILPFIEESLIGDCYYLEPFVGGANLIDKVKWYNRVGVDLNKYLIAMFQELQEGWEPPVSISEEEYKKVQQNKKDFPDYYVGYVGFNLSYGGKFFGGYRRDSLGKRDYSLEAYNNIKKQVPNIMGIEFICKSYIDLNIPDNTVVYCDPPYEGTTKYVSGGFNYDHFWNWVRELSGRCKKVLVSSYEAPPDFVSLWNKEVNASLTLDTGSKKNTENLFVLGG